MNQDGPMDLGDAIAAGLAEGMAQMQSDGTAAALDKIMAEATRDLYADERDAALVERLQRQVKQMDAAATSTDGDEWLATVFRLAQSMTLLVIEVRGYSADWSEVAEGVIERNVGMLAHAVQQGRIPMPRVTE